MDDQRRQETALQVGRIFTPASPVNEEVLFAGRIEQVRKVVDAINQRGQHPVIFGERGIGKTSLANILSSKLRAGVPVIAPRINCDSTDDFTGLWKKVLKQIDVIQKKRTPGFQLSMFQETQNAADVIGDNVTPDDVRRLFTFLGDGQLMIVILDEFDRLTSRATRRAVADTIKSFSDNDVPATIIVVGVADSIDDLITEHSSIERAIVQVKMERMEPFEIDAILENGMKRLEMQIDENAKRRIVILSQGLPTYAHQLGLHACRAALDRGRDVIELEDVRTAIRRAVENAEQSLVSSYQKAISSPQRANMFSEVLLACAMAIPDEFGCFAAADVRGPLQKIMNKLYGIPSFAKHLSEFTTSDRGAVLKKIGSPRRYRYRFTSPLMQPLVVMKGFIEHKIDEDAIESAIAGSRGLTY